MHYFSGKKIPLLVQYLHLERIAFLVLYYSVWKKSDENIDRPVCAIFLEPHRMMMIIIKIMFIIWLF